MSTDLAVVEKAAIKTAIAPRTALLEPQTLAELQQLGTLMAQSGFFTDARSAAQACVKILAGREMGFPPIASMTGVHVIEGKPSLGANLIAAAMKRAGYTWKVVQRDAKGCRLIISYRGQELGPAEFVEADAARVGCLGKSNWQKWPKSMYFARCITDAGRTYAPEVFGGIAPYTAEELGATNTTEDGAAIAPASPVVAEQRIAEEQQKVAEPKPPGRPTLDVQVDPKLQALWEQCGSQPGIETALGDVCSAIALKIGDDAAQEQFNRALMAYGVRNWKQLTGKQAKLVVRDLFLACANMPDPPLTEEAAQ